MPDKKTPEATLKKKRLYYQKNRRARLRYAKERYYAKREIILQERAEKRLKDPDYVSRQKKYQHEYYLKRKAKKNNER
jgi:hypothetical protein